MYEKSTTIRGKHSEKDIISKCIIPSLLFRGYSLDDIKEEYSFRFQGRTLRADIVIVDKNKKPFMVIEVKKCDKEVLKGLNQAMDYACVLGIELVFSTSGEYFLSYNRETGKKEELFLLDFPRKEDFAYLMFDEQKEEF